jgi:hypothetical protein
MVGLLLDRSIARIGELAADARHVDRSEVVWLAEVWDNYGLPGTRRRRSIGWAPPYGGSWT